LLTVGHKEHMFPTK